MGSAVNRSWSHSRQGLFDRCPRAFHFQYFPWDEADQDEARFLARVTTHELLAGNCVHWAIALALKAYRRDRTVVEDLETPALRRFREACATSRWTVDQMRWGRKPPSEGEVLHCEMYGYDGAARREAAEEAIRTCLANFLASEHWRVIRASDVATWEEIDPPQARMPRFRLAEPELAHAEVYAGFDLAFRHDGVTHVLDWKTGKRACARRQLAVYALGLASRATKPVPLEDIRVQAVWLRSPGAWEPEPVHGEALASARETIAAQILREASLTTRGKDGRGRDATLAERAAFPPSPARWKCVGCRFARICPQGREAVLATEETSRP